MKKWLAVLAEDRELSRIEKEIVMKTAVCSVFSYSAGFVDWTRNDIFKLWVRAYKQAWTLSGSIDSSPMILSVDDGDRGCPSAVDLLTREVYEVLEQCVGLLVRSQRLIISSSNARRMAVQH